MKLIPVYGNKSVEPTLWRLMVERSKEDDPFMPWAERKLPTKEAYFKDVRQRKYHRFFVIKVGRKHVGVILVQKNNEVGVILFPKYRSTGYGKEALELLLDEENPISGGHFRARIHPHNVRSIRMVESLGFLHRYNIYEL